MEAESKKDTKGKIIYTYETKTDEHGNVVRYKCWIQIFKDVDTGKAFPIKRRKPIKLNGEKIVWYSNSEIKQMSKAELKEIKLNLISK